MIDARTSRASRTRRVHPTRQKLIDTVIHLRLTEPYEDMSVERVLEISGISRGSLYHHFEDFYALIEAAELQRFTEYVDTSIEKISIVVETATSAQELAAGLKKITRATQKPEVAFLRADRIGAIARAINNPRFAAGLRLEQERLTQALADLTTRAQERGLARKDVDARAAAVLIQAYTLGRIVDDFSITQVDPEAWNGLIDLVVEQVFIGSACQ